MIFGLFLAGLVGVSTCLKVGIIHMHGLDESYDVPDHLNFKQYIEEATNLPVHLVDAFNKFSSLTPLAKQVPQILEKVKVIAAQYDKVIAVGYSQGGVIWRGMIESWDDHNVDTFISIASPQHGIAGPPPLLKKMVPYIDNFSRTPTFYLFVYSSLGQNLAPLNYYLDPYHYERYLKHAEFFPRLNNEKGTDEEKARQKSNFLRLRKLVLVGGPDEDALRPRESAQFGYYNERGNRDNVVIPMEETRFYKEDLFGLKSLDERGGVVMCTVKGPKHTEFRLRDDQTVMDRCVVTAVNDLVGQ